MCKTVRGIYLNLNKSEYSTSNGEVEFFFSSQFYLSNFLKRYREHRNEFEKRIARVIKLDGMNVSLLADIHLYIAIEKRGYRCEIQGDDSSWLNLLQFALQKMTEKNSRDWREMPVQN